MHKSITRAAIFASFVSSCLPLRASTVVVTGDSQVTLQPGGSLLFYISSDYAAHAPAGSPYPGQIDIVLGGLPESGSPAPIPGTSAVYTPGVVFSGTLESLNGAISIPLIDPDAARLGLPAGDLVLGTGERSGGSYSGPISDLTATAAISSPEAAALFASGEVVLDLRDLSGSFTFGYPGSTIGSAFSASFISPDGALSVGAMSPNVVLAQAPEPGTIGLLIIGLTIVSRRAMRRSQAR